MSDVTTGTVYNPQFFVNPPWWIGRVEAKETWVDNIEGETFTNAAEIEGWGYRYKVRVFNWHTGDLDKLPPKDMAFCQVVMPVTAGSGHGGAAQTPSLEPGSVVFGFFMDGMAGQEGYILGTLGNSNNNVPKERGGTAPTQSQKTPLTGGGVRVSSPPPVKPATGNNTGTASDKPLPANIDNASSETLKRYLNPARTPSKEEFKAATEARQKARSSGLPAAEVERQVLLATVKASKQSSSGASSSGNCNLGYQQFNNTYSDSSKNPAKVPDNLIVGNTPLSTTDSVHVETKAWTEQDEDRKKKQALLSACKKKNTQAKGIQRVIKNLINDVEKIKKQAGAINSKAEEISSQVQSFVSGAAEEISKYVKTIMGGVRGYILTKFQEKVKEIAPFLYPTEISKFNNLVEKGCETISCIFNKLIGKLGNLIGGLLGQMLDKVINAALCLIEDFLSNIIDAVLDPIMEAVNLALTPILAMISGVTGAVSGILGIFGNLTDALEFIGGIINFFKCDEDIDCPEYDEISLGSVVAAPGGDVVAAPSGSASQTTSPTGTGQGNTSTNVSAVISKNASNIQNQTTTAAPIRTSGSRQIFDPTNVFKRKTLEYDNRKYVPLDTLIGAAVYRDQIRDSAPTDADIGIGNIEINVTEE